MKEIDAYHLTDISNIKSIVIEGLIPSIGINSSYARESQPLLYFTDYYLIDYWINKFNYDRNRTIILKFKCYNYEKRYPDYTEYITTDSINPNRITICGDKEVPLLHFYKDNKEKIELELEHSIIKDILSLKNRLSIIENSSLEKEDSWKYVESEPDIITLINLFKKIRYFDNKNKYKRDIKEILDSSLKKLINNNLDITFNSEIYKSLNELYIDSLKDNHQIDIYSFNYITQIIITNLSFRLLDRFKRTKKKYNKDYSFYELNEIETINPYNESIIPLLNETKILHEDYNNFRR